MEAYSLLKVNEYIRQVIALNFEDSIWIDAEVSQAREVRGQLYMEFIEKSAENDSIVARAQGVAWYKALMFIRKKLGDLYES
ncbi:exodeoxyribonuclease VII large subunit, partial [Arthrospira platensis SPKY1]|nr:exodeoxyribonuclease VII large subunit [Arthrospira platensis SPKY1]